MNDDFPCIRTDIQITPAMYEGRRVLMIQDLLGLIDPPMLVDEQMVPLLSLLDGTHSTQDLRTELTKAQGDVIVPDHAVQRLLARLDQGYLLQSERYRQAYREVVDEYRRQTVRTPTCAGTAYPDDPGELAHYLDAMVQSEPQTGQTDNIAGLVAPHIDLRVGERGYARAYGAMRHLRPELIVVLGVGHQMDHGYFSLTAKDYETPFGRVETDKDLVARLAEAGNPCVASHDLAHRDEHSIEFQLIFLQHILARCSFKVAPMLCGGFHGQLSVCDGPDEIAGVHDLLEALKQELAGRNALVLAGVDMSHIGLKFQDPDPAALIADEAEKHDRALLHALSRGDAKAFWAESRRVADRYHVCGMSALLCALHLLEPCRGNILHYETWHEKETQSAVSFAAATLHRT